MEYIYETSQAMTLKFFKCNAKVSLRNNIQDINELISILKPGAIHSLNLWNKSHSKLIKTRLYLYRYRISSSNLICILCSDAKYVKSFKIRGRYGKTCFNLSKIRRLVVFVSYILYVIDERSGSDNLDSLLQYLSFIIVLIIYSHIMPVSSSFLWYIFVRNATYVTSMDSRIRLFKFYYTPIWASLQLTSDLAIGCLPAANNFIYVQKALFMAKKLIFLTIPVTNGSRCKTKCQAFLLLLLFLHCR